MIDNLKIIVHAAGCWTIVKFYCCGKNILYKIWQVTVLLGSICAKSMHISVTDASLSGLLIQPTVGALEQTPGPGWSMHRHNCTLFRRRSRMERLAAIWKFRSLFEHMYLNEFCQYANYTMSISKIHVCK
ncbi:hypothetical protein XELAEV_18015781mg [Xenopus laevis]|uniref:Uncharacterized protein n=1 Tax=Xenopus laevis TaxID=8355 RepID=A0A974HWA9_XENLA|nr:hypothetical protein XELAEV_18015781mg [Xenopus laevis]